MNEFIDESEMTIDSITIPTAQELGYIDNDEIIKYIKNKGLYESYFSNLGVMQSQLYNIAKLITIEDSIQAQNMMKYIEDIEYIKGYEAYIYSLNQDELKIDNIINSIREDFDINGNYEIYVNCLLSVAFSVVVQYPYKSLILFNDINNTYDVTGTIPSEMLDLAVDIVDNISSHNIEKAIEVYEQIVEIECYQIDALEKILSKTKDENIKQNIERMITTIKDIQVKKIGR